ncbi:MAG: NAD(P)H-binding protein, partial [Sphingomonadales bacterium]|nr:NAD(P)H-binding protein [Sphingomonadales bacterium]
HCVSAVFNQQPQVSRQSCRCACPSNITPPRAGVEWIAGDLADRAALDRLLDGAEAVIHVAGVVNAPDAAGFEAGNVAGTLELVEAAVRRGVPRMVHVSSLSAREPALSLYGASKARAEKVVMASGLDWTIVRPPAIYGFRDKELLALFRAARWGLVPMPQKAGRASYIHVDDLARLLIALVPGGEAVTGRIFEPDDGREGGWSHRDIARGIGWAVGRRPVVLHLAPGMLAFAGRLSRLALGQNARLTPDRAAYMAHPDWVSSPAARVPPALWVPKVPTREGLRATAKWYREQRWL